MEKEGPNAHYFGVPFPSLPIFYFKFINTESALQMVKSNR